MIIEDTLDTRFLAETTIGQLGIAFPSQSATSNTGWKELLHSLSRGQLNGRFDLLRHIVLIRLQAVFSDAGVDAELRHGLLYRLGDRRSQMPKRCCGCQLPKRVWRSTSSVPFRQHEIVEPGQKATPMRWTSPSITKHPLPFRWASPSCSKVCGTVSSR